MYYNDSNVQLMLRYIQFIVPANTYALLKYMSTNVHTHAYRLLNHLLTLSRASIFAPLTSRRATTSLWPQYAATVRGVSPVYPRQREGREIIIIRDHIKPD